MRTLFLLLLISLQASATNYFCASQSDYSTTIARTYAPGDSVFFSRGQTFTGQWVFAGAGSYGRPVYIGAYGTGAKPILTTRTALENWSNPASWTLTSITGIWRMYLPSSQNTVHRFWLNGTEYNSSYTGAGVTSILRTSYTRNYDSLWVYSIGNPATFYSSIEYSSQQQQTLYFSSTSYVTVENIEVRGGSDRTIGLVFVSNIVIKNSKVGIDGAHIGIGAFAWADSITLYRDTIDSGDKRVKNFLNIHAGDGVYLTSGCHNWDIGQCFVTNYTHSQIEVQNMNTAEAYHLKNGYSQSNIFVHDNKMTAPNVDYGRGCLCNSPVGKNINNIVITRNLVDSTSVKLQLNCPGLVFTYNVISNTRNTTTGNVGSGNGIDISGYSNTSPINMVIANNTIYRCQESGIRFNRSIGYSPLYGNTIANNILYDNARDAYDAVLRGVQITMESSDVVAGNNFYNNLLYSPAYNRVYYDNREAVPANRFFTIAQFNARTGTRGDVVNNNVSADPMFTSGANLAIPITSPAYGTGLTGTYNTLLLSGSAWPYSVLTGTQSAAWNIGAYGIGAAGSGSLTVTGIIIVN